MNRIFVLLILILTFQVFAQDTSTAKYLLLKVGNIWVYYGFSGTVACHSSSWYDRYRITGTTQINGKKYFLFEHTQVYVTGQCSWSCTLFQADAPIRVDSLSLNIYKSINCTNSNESLVDSLEAKINDTSLSCEGRKVCFDTSSFNICGINRPAKNFIVGGWESNVSQRYAKNIGLVSSHYYCNGTYDINLRGCVIDGVLCGDTSMLVGVQNISSEVPERFQLSQNYPNPFNPNTKIRFAIPPLKGDRAMNMVRLVIYDALGKELAVLVNEQLKPGTYEIDWDGTNFPSGVYFYKLEAGDASTGSGQSFVQTKKMLLIK